MQVTKLGLYVLHYKNINKMNNLIPVNEPSLMVTKKYVLECIKSGWISSEGPFIKKFEQKMSSYFKGNIA